MINLCSINNTFWSLIFFNYVWRKPVIISYQSLSGVSSKASYRLRRPIRSFNNPPATHGQLTVPGRVWFLGVNLLGWNGELEPELSSLTSGIHVLSFNMEVLKSKEISLQMTQKKSFTRKSSSLNLAFLQKQWPSNPYPWVGHLNTIMTRGGDNLDEPNLKSSTSRRVKSGW